MFFCFPSSLPIEKPIRRNNGNVQIKFSSPSAPTKIEELTAGSDEKTQRSFSSDPAVSCSIFVRAEGEENLIRNDPDNSGFTNGNVAITVL